MASKSNYLKKKCLALGVASAVALFSAGAVTAAEKETFEVNIKASSVEVALLELAEKSGAQIVLAQNIGKDVELPALNGAHTLSSALDAMLSGTGLEYEFLSDDSVIIKATTEAEADVDETDVDEEVVVTGSRLKVNPAELSGNRVVLDREYIERSGEVTLPDLLRKLPQTANNTVNIFGANLNGAENLSAATSINLRGLGTNNTLILVDGRRIGSHGLAGGVTDISAIPLGIVERVDILLEGASAIYGADAVGGVINIITRRDYEAWDVSLDYSQPAIGETSKGIFTASGGFSWESGRARVGLEYQKDRPLDAGAVPQVSTLHENTRDFGFGSALNVTGNDGATIFYTGPNNITVGDFALLTPAEQAAYMPVTAFTAPEGWDGSDLNAITVFEATPPTHEDQGRNRTLIPDTERRSISVGIEQALSESITATLDLSYAQRETTTARGNVAYSSSTWAGINPFNPFGVDVSLSGWVPGIPETPVNTFTEGDDANVNLKLEGDFGDSSWSWEVTGGYSRNTQDSINFNFVNSTLVGQSLGTDGSPQTVFLPLPTQAECESFGATWVEFFPGFGFCQQVTVIDPLDPFTSDFSSLFVGDSLSNTVNKQQRFEAIARGTLFKLPGGDVQVAVGGNWREDNSVVDTEFNQSRGPAALIGFFDSEITREQRSLFLEGFAPLVSEANNLPGINSLSMSFSARWDDYPDPSAIRNDLVVDPCENEPGGCNTSYSDTTYAVGFTYTPVDESLRFRLNWSTAFAAPQLSELFQPRSTRDGFLFYSLPEGVTTCPDGWTPFPGFPGCELDVTNVTGGNPALGPETSTTYSVGLDYEPGWASGLSLSVTWDALDTTDRITQIGSFLVRDPDNLPPSISFNELTGNLENNFRPINVGSIERDGIDYVARYDIDTSFGRFDMQALYTKTLGMEVTPDASNPNIPPTELVGGVNGFTVVPPVPEYAASAQLGWIYGGLRASVDYAKSGSIRSAPTSRVQSIGKAPTLYNMTFAYDFESGTLFDAPSWLDGTQVTLRVNNVTNNYPTFLESIDGGPFEQDILRPSAAYVTGRSFGINIRKTIQ